MSTGDDKDPNEEYENKIGPDHPPLNPAEAWGEKQNPVRDTAEPWTNVRDGGTPGGAG